MTEILATNIRETPYGFGMDSSSHHPTTLWRPPAPGAKNLPIRPQGATERDRKIAMRELSTALDSFESQSVHFRTDLNMYNVQRWKLDRISVTEVQLDQLSDLGSQCCLSGTYESNVKQPRLPQIAD